MKTKNELSWIVKYYNCNSNKIENYDILKCETENIKKLKKKANGNKEIFVDELQCHLMYHYWSKCEWEVIVQKANDRILIYPWCGCRNPEEVTIDVTDDTSFDWVGFANKYIGEQDFGRDKIDVWNQIKYNWDNFVDYCWNTRLKYERIKEPQK